MEYTTLGTSGLKVSRVCLGTMTFGGQSDAEESGRIVRAAMDKGVNFIDTANIYPVMKGGVSESIVGESLRGVRDQVVLATKAGGRMGRGVNDSGLSRAHLVRSVEDSPAGAYAAGHYFCYNFEIPASRASRSVERGNLAKDKYWPRYAAV